MSQTIQLNDEAVLNVSWCGASEGILWVDGLSMTLLEALTIFSDSSKTSIITVQPEAKIHEGYTTLIHLSVTYGGLTKVALRKEV